MTDHREKRRSEINPYRRISRGLLRIWVAFTVVVTTGMMLMLKPYPLANWRGWNCGDSEGVLYVVCLYQVPTPAQFPVRVHGRSGVPWGKLTFVQQSLALSSAADQGTWVLAGLPPKSWADAHPAPKSYADMVKDFEVFTRPENATYQLIPIADLLPRNAGEFRRLWIEPLNAERELAIRLLLEWGFGVPLAVLLCGFLVLRIGRWVWAGFAASP